MFSYSRPLLWAAVFAGLLSLPAAASEGAWVMADFNGDHKPDIAAADYGSNMVSILINQGAGNFAPKVDYATGSGPYSVAARDFNGDGSMDIAVADSNVAKVSILLNKGDGTFLPKVDYTTGPSPFSIVIADFNHDGKPDLATANYDDSSLSVLTRVTCARSSRSRCASFSIRAPRTMSRQSS